jgi:hypothetical protein
MVLAINVWMCVSHTPHSSLLQYNKNYRSPTCHCWKTSNSIYPVPSPGTCSRGPLEFGRETGSIRFLYSSPTSDLPEANCNLWTWSFVATESITFQTIYLIAVFSNSLFIRWVPSNFSPSLISRVLRMMSPDIDEKSIVRENTVPGYRGRLIDGLMEYCDRAGISAICFLCLI